MVIIRERNGKFLNFFTPSMVVVIGGILLNFLNLLISFIIFFIDPFSQWDIIIVNLLLLLISQVFGVFLVYFLFIPLFKARNVEYSPLNLLNSVKAVALIFVTFSLVFISNFILVYIFKVFNAIPKSGYTNILINSEHLKNPINVLLFFLPLTIGAPVYEEFVYRRLLIPLMEERGMNPVVAVLTSSFVFAIGHFPNDLVNGNLQGGILHVWGVFLIGMSLGLIYVLTRNILYPIIIHGVLNFISFTGPIVLALGNDLLLTTYNIIIFLILFVGLGIFIFILWQFFRKRDVKWIGLLGKKTCKPVKYGSFGFLMIGTIGAFIPLAIQFFLINLAVYNVFLYFIILIGSFGFLIILFSWLGTRSAYGSNVN